MKSPWNTWRLMVAGLLALLLAACKPYASFEVTPEPVTAGKAATFDASNTMVSPKPRNNAPASYQWDFGDGANGSGQVTTHTYATAGTFTVTLTVTDLAGRVGTSRQTLVVEDSGDGTGPETGTVPLKVSVQLAGGVPLSGAQVAVGTVSAVSDPEGLATIEAAPVGADQLVTVSKSGYITQVIRTTLTGANGEQGMLIVLVPEKETLAIASIEAAQTINARQLGAAITLPTHALVNAKTGAPASGPATLKLTPWEVSGIDSQAMLGNGQGLDASNNLVSLISAGMMTVEFFDMAGNKLQVASNKSVDIRMSLPVGLSAIGDRALSGGTSLPVWHFDETLGLWREEEMGQVEVTDTGLDVTATVTHFSTWSWASIADAVTTVRFQCVNDASVRVPCTVIVQASLPGGSLLTRTARIPSTGGSMTDIPTNAQLLWTASTSDGLMGEARSGATATVSIPVRTPLTSNLVRCSLADGSATECQVELIAPLSDGASATVRKYLPATGGTVSTLLNTTGPLQWRARTSATRGVDGQWNVLTGTASSGTTGSVDIALSTPETALGKTITARCNPTVGAVTLSTCNITVFLGGEDDVDRSLSVIDGLNGPFTVTIPPIGAGQTVTIAAAGTAGNNAYSGYVSLPYDAIDDGQAFDIELEPFGNGNPDF